MLTFYSKLSSSHNSVTIRNRTCIYMNSFDHSDLGNHLLHPVWNVYSFFKAWRKNTSKMQQYRWFIVNSRCCLLTTVSTCFGHLYAHHQEKRPRITAYGLYLLVVLDVAGCDTVVLRWGCEHCEGCCWTARAANFTVPQPATSNTTSKYTPYAVTRGLFSWWWA